MGLPRTLISAFQNWCENDDIKLITAVVKGENSAGLSIGSHVVISKEEYESAIESGRDQSIRAGSFFPTRFDGYVRQQLTVSAAGVVLTDPKKVTEDRKVLRIDKFDYKKLPDICNYIKENGALTLIMDNMCSCLDFFKDIDDIKKGFGYASPLGFRRTSDTYTPNPKFEDDIIEMFIDIYDIKYAIPIFNFREAEGLAFNIGLFWRDASTERKTSLIEEYQFAVNKYKSNLLEFDGEKIRKKDYIIDKNYHEHMTNNLRNEIMRRKKAESTQKKPVKKVAKCESPEVVSTEGNPCPIITTAPRPIPATYKEWIEQHEPKVEDTSRHHLVEEIMDMMTKNSDSAFYNNEESISVREFPPPATFRGSGKPIEMKVPRKAGLPKGIRTGDISEVKLFDAPSRVREVYGSRYFSKAAGGVEEVTTTMRYNHSTGNLTQNDSLTNVNLSDATGPSTSHWTVYPGDQVVIVPKNDMGDLVMSGSPVHEPSPMYDVKSVKADNRLMGLAEQYGYSAVSNDSHNKKKKGKGE